MRRRRAQYRSGHTFGILRVVGSHYTIHSKASKRQFANFTPSMSPWWTLRSAELIDRVHYPATSSPDEWATELLQLDQMVVEGFESKWLRNKAATLGKSPDPKLASLALIEECFIALGFAEDEAKCVVAPLRRAHDLRTKLKGHASGKESLARIRREALSSHGTYRDHFRGLCAECDRSIRAIAAAFQKLA